MRVIQPSSKCWFQAMLTGLVMGLPLPSQCAFLEPCQSHMAAEAWLDPQADLGGLSLNLAHCPTSFLAVQGGMSAYTDHGMAFSGLNASIRFQLGSPVSVYAGLGVLVGYNEHEVPAPTARSYLSYNQDTHAYVYKESTFSSHLFQETGVEIFTGDRGIAFGIRHYLDSGTRQPQIQGQRVLSMSVLFVH